MLNYEVKNNKIPKTVEELTQRVEKIYDQYYKSIQFSENIDEKKSLCAPEYFQNNYDDLNCVKYEFQYMNVRLDYCGLPILKKGVAKRIKFILSNNSKSLTSDRVNIYLYSREGCKISPERENSTFLTMAHMGNGIKSIEYEITWKKGYRSVHHFIAEFRFEDSKKGKKMLVPFVLVSEAGETIPVKWEKRGVRETPNMPKI